MKSSYNYWSLQDLKLSLLVSKINETESAMAEIETAASKHLQGLALQSEQALESAQKKLMLTNEKVEEFTKFVKVWIIFALLPCTLVQAELVSGLLQRLGEYLKVSFCFSNPESILSYPTYTLFKIFL